MRIEDIRIRSGEDLIAALKFRRAELGLRQGEVDLIAGLPGWMSAHVRVSNCCDSGLNTSTCGRGQV